MTVTETAGVSFTGWWTMKENNRIRIGFFKDGPESFEDKEPE